MGLTAALSTAGRSLELFSAGIQVAGNNISNSSSPDYIREKLILKTAFPVQTGSLIFGTGAYAGGIRQQIDKYLEQRLYVASADYFGSDARNTIYKQLEVGLQELGDADISSQFNGLVSKFNDLVNQPELATTRELVVRQAQQFTDAVSTLRTRIDRMRVDVGVQLKDLVTEANRLIDTIADLNPKITAMESAGLLQSDAGALRSQRYDALNRLSQIVPIRTIEHPAGGIDVFIGNDDLVIPGKTQHLETVASVDRGVVVSQVRVEGASDFMTGTQGIINGVVAGRDKVVGSFLDQFDQFTSNLIYEVNKLHSSGQGLTGFDGVSGTYAIQDPAASLDAAGLSFVPEHGSFQVTVRNKSTGATQTTTINVDLDNIGPNTTFNDLLAQLNGVSNLTASTTPDRKLSLTAASGFEFQFSNDTSGALAALGINTLFTGSSSRDIGVNSVVANDSSKLAVGLGGGPGDGTNAARIAAIADQTMAGLGGKSPTAFYQTILSNLAQGSATEQTVAVGYRGFREALLSQRSQYSGVSLDEETIDIMKFQHSYAVAARFISTIDELFTALLQV